ncbi:DUF6573 family protein [Tundrisphaera lichenicola]|uniref:DUF6573 family protein n=1 Tax=Tundrisphaera lichenicola TaxID=2029860 RepID=UPI003EBBA9A4
MTGWNVIFSYTRAEAIADGVLVDVSKMAKEAGLKYPVALTSGVWAECVAVPEGVEGQDEDGRLWDVLFMLTWFIRRGNGGDRVDFGVHVRKDNAEKIPPLVKLYALCGPGDDGEPVITIMLPHED